MEFTNTKCYICNSSELNKVFGLENYPAYIVPVPTDISKSIARRNLALHNCHVCGHMQTIAPDPELQELIYEEYYSHYTVDSSESFAPHYRVPFIDFCKRLREDGILANKENILEIGCSSGRQVNFLKQFASNYYGIDPSERIHLAIKEYPYDTFIHGYFPQDISNVTFDAIVSQFNLEHIGKVQEFMSTIHESLSTDGLIVLQVPDIEDFRRNKQPNFMAHEHVQYFTKNSMRKLLESQGFEIAGWGSNGPSLIVAAKKIAKPTNYEFSAETNVALSNAEEQKKLFLNVPTDIPAKVIYYGVGPQLYWLLSNRKDRVGDCMIFDDNSSYENQGLPGFENRINKPSLQVLQEYKCVVLSLNSFYHSIVLDKLKSFNIKIQVHHIDESGSWVRTQLN